MSSASILWAVHLSDGVIATPWWLMGWIGAAILLLLALWRMDDREIPRLGILTAAFFVTSQIHLPLGGTSVHLLMNGLVGTILGRRVGLVLAVGLGMQALLFGHGGWTTLGLNITIYTLPALVAGILCRVLWRSQILRVSAVRFLFVMGGIGLWLVTAVMASQRLALRLAPNQFASPTDAESLWIGQPIVWVVVGVGAALVAYAERRLEQNPDFAIGLVLGAGTAYITVALNALTLKFGGLDVVRNLADVVVLANLPIVLVEAVAVGFVMVYLAKARPDWLGDKGRHMVDSGNTSSNGTSH